MKKLLFIVIALYSSASIASTASGGTLRYIHFMSNGVVIVYTSGSRSGSIPSCAANQYSRFAIDGTTSGGKVQVAGILSAHATGKTVVIFGSDNCSVWSDTETINYFHTAD